MGACGGGSGNSNGNTESNGTGNTQTASNMAQFIFECDLNGLGATLALDVEVVQTSGLVFGPGPNPDITAVIPTGEVIYFTSGSLDSPTASYIFEGENQFADFTSTTNFERFRVEWIFTENGIAMIINPFGDSRRHDCIFISSQYT